MVDASYAMNLAIEDYEFDKRMISACYTEEWDAETECAFIEYVIEQDGGVVEEDGRHDYFATYEQWKGKDLIARDWGGL